MAVKITAEAIVKTVKPEKYKFSLDELNSHVDGWIEPLKVGLFWVMYKENADKKGEPLNQIASFFFDVALYGTVLIVPPQQMPDEWELMEDGDHRYTADQIDAGFLTSLQNALVMYRSFGGQVVPDIAPKEEWIYTPPIEIDDNTIAFFKAAYETIIDQKNYSELIYDDGVSTLKTKTIDDKIKTLQLMMEYFINEEEYEKCANLRNYIEDITENVNNLIPTN